MKFYTFLPFFSSVACSIFFYSSTYLAHANIGALTSNPSTSSSPTSTLIASSSILSEAINQSKAVTNTLPNSSISFYTDIGNIVNMAKQQAQVPHSAGQSLLEPNSFYATDTIEMTTPPLHRVSNNSLQTEVQEMRSIPLLEAVPSYFEYYSQIAIIKELLPDEIFHAEILPLVQKAFKSEPQNQITYKDWRLIEEKVLSLKESHDVDFATLYLNFLEKKSIKESVSNMLTQVEEDMNNLGEEIGSQFEKFVKENKDLFIFQKQEETPSIQSL